MSPSRSRHRILPKTYLVISEKGKVGACDDCYGNVQLDAAQAVEIAGFPQHLLSVFGEDVLKQRLVKTERLTAKVISTTLIEGAAVDIMKNRNPATANG